MNITNSPLFTSNSEVWETPQDLFDELNEKHHFTIDVCALPANAKCAKYYTPDVDGLSQSWQNEIVWCNPPYGKQLKYWIAKAYDESLQGARICLLLLARTDTKWFHEYIYGIATIVFIKGRLTFSNAAHSAPFPSMLVYYNLTP